MALRLATFNVENLFARAKALDLATWDEGQEALAAFDTFNAVAQEDVYTDADKATMLQALTTLRYLVRTSAGLRLNKRPFDDAWAVLRENRGDFLVAPAKAEPRIVAGGRKDWLGWVELTNEPVDEVATRMTAKVVNEVGADVLCVVEADSRPSLVRFNQQLLGNRYGHALLIDGNDLRGIDVGLLCNADIDVRWMRSHVDEPDDANPDRMLFSRDCPVYHLRLPGGTDLFVMPNHLKSQSFAGGNPDPLRTRQSERVAAIYRQLRADGAELIAVLGDLNKGSDKNDPRRQPTLEALFPPRSSLVDAYGLPKFRGLFDPKDPGHQRPGTFQSCTLTNRLDYILLSPELAELVTGGGVFRKGLWGNPGNVKPPKLWSIYPEITEARHAASDHAAVWVDLNL
ncbi:MAG TPA: endonuclease/exonuclease/phosphatase family protein [Candidatus Limnocylindrales bacterium]